MIILNDLKLPTLEKRRKVTRLTTMFKVVSSLSAIQVPPYILFKRRKDIRKFHLNSFIQVDAEKKKTNSNTVLLQVQSETGTSYQIVSLKSSQKRLSKRPSCVIYNSRFCRPWKRFTYLLLTQT